jgi:hypothetical protein
MKLFFLDHDQLVIQSLYAVKYKQLKIIKNSFGVIAHFSKGFKRKLRNLLKEL